MPNKPTPTHLKLLRGNPGKRAIPKDEPEPELGAAPPDWLTAEAAKHWPLVAKQLNDARILTQIDGTALGLYCEAFARWKYASEQLAKFGPVVKSPDSGFPVRSPFLRIADQAWEHMVKLLIEFGMTPSSRTRVKVAKPVSHDDDLSEFTRAG